MALHWSAQPAADRIIDELSRLYPENAFASPAFVAARQKMGYAAWVLALRDDGGAMTLGCAAYLKKGRLNTVLEMPSMPPAPADSQFWSSLVDLCGRNGVTRLELDSFGSPPGAALPDLAGRCERGARTEFVLDLSAAAAAPMSSNHKRNIKRGAKAGLVVRRTREAAALGEHRGLMERSMQRRRTRGEDIAAGGEPIEEQAYLACGAGELFQAIDGEEVRSSILVLGAPAGAYYHSAGSSPEGMATGASHFLIDQVAQTLRAEGKLRFNLGGADLGSSLATFKQGFGTMPVALTAGACDVGTGWRRVLVQAVELVRGRGARTA